MTARSAEAGRQEMTRLDRRLRDIAWGLLLMLTGSVWLVPVERLPTDLRLLDEGRLVDLPMLAIGLLLFGAARLVRQRRPPSA